MEPFDLNAIEVNVEIDQSDSPVHIIWNDGRKDVIGELLLSLWYLRN